MTKEQLIQLKAEIKAKTTETNDAKKAWRAAETAAKTAAKVLAKKETELTKLRAKLPKK